MHVVFGLKTSKLTLGQSINKYVDISKLFIKITSFGSFIRNNCKS